MTDLSNLIADLERLVGSVACIDAYDEEGDPVENFEVHLSGLVSAFRRADEVRAPDRLRERLAEFKDRLFRARSETRPNDSPDAHEYPGLDRAADIFCDVFLAYLEADDGR
jgi:hypothetical protein